jgi:hypothetical protein
MNNWLLTDKSERMRDCISTVKVGQGNITIDIVDYNKMFKAQARHIFERLNEECTDSHYRLGEQLYTRKECGMSPIPRGKCPQCMAEFEKELK